MRAFSLPALTLALALAVGCGEKAPSSADDFIAAQDYNGLIGWCSEHSDSLLMKDICEVNVALAETGQLAERAFDFPQALSAGLLPQWDKTREVAECLSDAYFAMGHIALAQRMAFEATVISDSLDARMYRRLVETNIIYGAYPIAEKYISLLEREGQYADWAKAQRRFLNDDEAVEADSLYALKRGCIPSEDFLSPVRDIAEDLKDIARQNPAHRSTVEYLGLYYLLDFDFDNFKTVLSEFYQEEPLPKSFREAVCMLSELEPGYWKEMGVSRKEYDRYKDFLKRMDPWLDISRHKNTFWYYIMEANQHRDR